MTKIFRSFQEFLGLKCCQFLYAFSGPHACVFVLCVCVCTSVCISVWTIAEGGVSSNLGQSRDGKVNTAVEHRATDTHTHTHNIDSVKHTYRHWKASTHRKRYDVKRSRFTLRICRCVPLTCMSVYGGTILCVQSESSERYFVLFGAMWYSSWEAKDNTAGKREEREWERKWAESRVWISLKCSIWWVIIFTIGTKSILFPKGVTAAHFLPISIFPNVS